MVNTAWYCPSKLAPWTFLLSGSVRVYKIGSAFSLFHKLSFCIASGGKTCLGGNRGSGEHEGKVNGNACFNSVLPPVQRCMWMGCNELTT